MDNNEAISRPWELTTDEHAVDYTVQNEAFEIISSGLSQEDAELIVTAVNAHDPMLAALKAVEWSGRTIKVGNKNFRTCPKCRGMRRFKHSPDCQLAAAITQAEKV